MARHDVDTRYYVYVTMYPQNKSYLCKNSNVGIIME
jgi:hypothetical protein